MAEKLKCDDALIKLLVAEGYWVCRECSTESRRAWHRSWERSCTKTGKVRRECEIPAEELT